MSKYRIPFFFLIFIFIIAGTFIAILFARGYRLDFVDKKIKPHGVLITTSVPLGARVFINGELETATNNTLNLEPKEYEIKIQKEGYIPWQKQMLVEKELVTQAEAHLFLKTPDLRPITYSGLQNPIMCPDSSKLLYIIPLSSTTNKTSTPSALKEEAGVWVLDLNDSPFGVNKPPKQIVKSQTNFDFSKATLSWSPDCRQVLADFSPSIKYLLSADQLTPLSSLTNVTDNLTSINKIWQKENQIKFESKIKKVPETLKEILTQNTREITFSLDGTKVSYLATASAEIPEKLIPLVPASSTQKETRKIIPGRLYVYDIKEDKNFEISNFEIILPTPTPKSSKKKTIQKPNSQLDNSQFAIRNSIIPQWFPTSRHLVWIKDTKIVVCEYDNTNFTEIYSGPFEKPFLFTAGTNKIIILTKINFTPSEKSNLFEVNLR